MIAKKRKGLIATNLLQQKSWTELPPENDARRDELTIDEAMRMSTMLVGKPICFNHCKDNIVGRIIDSKVNGSNWEVEFELNDDEYGFAALGIDERLFYSLSLAHHYPAMIPQEVSLCHEGARPGTIVYPDQTNAENYKESTDIIIQASRTRPFSINMSDSNKMQDNTPVAQSAPAPTAAASSIDKPSTREQLQQLREDITQDSHSTFKAYQKLLSDDSLSKADKEAIRADLVEYARKFEEVKQMSETTKKELEAKQKEIEKLKATSKSNRQAYTELLKRIPNLTENDKSSLDQMRDSGELDSLMNSSPGQKLIECFKSSSATFVQRDPTQEQNLQLFNEFMTMRDRHLNSGNIVHNASASYRGKRSHAAMSEPSQMERSHATTTSNKPSVWNQHGIIDPEIVKLLESAPDGDIYPLGVNTKK